MAVGYIGDAGGIQDEKERTKNGSLWNTKQDVVRSGSLGAHAYFVQAIRKE